MAVLSWSCSGGIGGCGSLSGVSCIRCRIRQVLMPRAASRKAKKNSRYGLVTRSMGRAKSHRQHDRRSGAATSDHDDSEWWSSAVLADKTQPPIVPLEGRRASSAPARPQRPKSFAPLGFGIRRLSQSTTAATASGAPERGGAAPQQPIFGTTKARAMSTPPPRTKTPTRPSHAGAQQPPLEPLPAMPPAPRADHHCFPPPLRTGVVELPGCSAQQSVESPVVPLSPPAESPIVPLPPLKDFKPRAHRRTKSHNDTAQPPVSPPTGPLPPLPQSRIGYSQQQQQQQQQAPPHQRLTISGLADKTQPPVVPLAPSSQGNPPPARPIRPQSGMVPPRSKVQRPAGRMSGMGFAMFVP